MAETVDRLEQEEGLRGVVFASAKKVFFAGGDLYELLAAEPGNEAQFMDMLRNVKSKLRRLEKLPVPVVAAINGAALGGGFEICLACNYRIAWDDKSVQLGFGLIGFRLYLADGVSTATVRISFDQQVPRNAQLYKYLIDSGWQLYRNAVFAADGRSVTLMLTDGGAGDEDGVVNGVIVDPTGIAYTETDSAALATSGLGSSSENGAGCFIGAGLAAGTGATVPMLLILLGLGGVAAVATGRQ